MNYIENFGLEYLMETEEDTKALCRAVCAQGKTILGYYGLPYINFQFGWPQFIARLERMDDDKYVFAGLDTHMCGVTTWTFRVNHSFKASDKDDPLTRRVMVSKTTDGTGLAMITLVNADVLPSYLEGDEVTAQMIAFPIHINYYENEEAYEADQPEMLNGGKMLLGDGTVFPAGLMRDKENKTAEEENIMLIRGTVKKAQRGLVQFGEMKDCPFIDVIIGTEFGDLEIVHTMEQVEESGRLLIKEGSVVSGLFVLSGDVAIGTYKDGFVRDFEHNLAVLRYTIQEGEAKRLGTVLHENAAYFSEWTQDTFFGREAVINRLNYVKDSNPERPFFAHFATITNVDEGEEELPYGVGDRCIVIAMETADNLESICFMECDEDNWITKIVVTRNSRYHFAIDEKKTYECPVEGEPPKDWYESILARARFHFFIDYDLWKEDIEEASLKSGYYASVAQNIAAQMKANPVSDILSFLPALYSYLFAKAIELQVDSDDREDLTYPIDMFAIDKILQEYAPDERDEYLTKRLLASYELGAQFYKDFMLHRERAGTEEGFEEDLVASLVFVQQIGEVYARTRLKENRKE